MPIKKSHLNKQTNKKTNKKQNKTKQKKAKKKYWTSLPSKLNEKKKKKEEAGNAYPINQKKNEEEAGNVQEKKKKNRQAMSKRKKKSVNFCPKMMPNFSLQFSLHFGEKTFCGSWEKMLVKYGLHLIQNRRSGKLIHLFHSQLITCVTTPPHLCRYCPL